MEIAAKFIIVPMHLSAETLRLHLDYTQWATMRLLDVAMQLTSEELNRDFGTSEHSVLGTLVHTFAGDRIWLYRVAGGANPGFVSDADRSLAVLEQDWPAVLERWRLWAANLTDESTDALLDYTDLKGNPHRQPIWQIVLHVVNHGTHHRGQVSGFLRALGRTPPPLDLIYFYRAL
jgi:uncharacterized damage-inducible protein DinB